MTRIGVYVCVSLLAASASESEVAADARPRSVGFLSLAENGNRHLESLQETARVALIRKDISVEEIVLECSPDAECMRNAIRDAGVEIGVYVWLWEPTADRPEAVVGVMLKEAGGVSGFDEVAEERSCASSDCDRVIEALVEELLERWPERRGTRLSLTGTPPGAAIFDGASLVGTVPGDLRLSWGEHRLRIASRGYEPEMLQVTAGPSPEEARRVDLVRLAEPSAPVDGKKRYRRAAMIASGVALLAGGGVLIGLGGASYGNSGGCDGTMPCENYTTTNAGAGVMLGLGIGSVGGGLSLLIKGIRER